MKNQELLALSYPQMVREVLVIMSFLNTTPYKTLGIYISQAKKFQTKPEEFDDLINILVNGSFKDVVRVEKATEAVFESLENILENEGLSFAYQRLD